MSTVYFTDLRTRPKRNLLDKISELLAGPSWRGV